MTVPTIITPTDITGQAFKCDQNLFWTIRLLLYLRMHIRTAYANMTKFKKEF